MRNGTFKFRTPLAILLITGTCSGACLIHSRTTSTRSDSSVQRVINLHAFARLYGVVRWFHPSDAAATIDWDRFAIDGVRRVVNVLDASTLRTALRELFSPIAPTVQLADSDTKFADDPALPPQDAAKVKVVAWEHLGYGDTAIPGVYASKRRYRDRVVAAEGALYGAIWQAIEATPYRGMRIRLRGKIRTSPPGRGQLWLRVERGDSMGFADNMADRPIMSQTWQPAEISGVVDGDATRIVLGTTMSGLGTVWYDDLDLAVQATNHGMWTPVEIRDPGFEARDPLTNWSPGLGRGSATTTNGWKLGVDDIEPAAGTVSLRVEPITRLATEELFPESPRPGETIDVDLGAGLRARVPIALYSIDGHTIGDAPRAARSQIAAPTVTAAANFDEAIGLADVIVAWNALEHFWPYWDTVSINWLSELDRTLRDALDDRTLDDHVKTLQRLSSAAPDGHARVGCPGRPHDAAPPFAVDVIEGHTVITATGISAVERGDLVVALDGHPAADVLSEGVALASGTPQFRLVRARNWFGRGPIGSTVTLRLRRAGVERDVTVERNDQSVETFSRPAIERLEDGMYYVDLIRASMAELDSVMLQLAAAPAVVFDVRGHPNGNHKVLSHLLTHKDDFKAWLAIPHLIRPDHQPTSVAGWTTDEWELPALQPHITGHVAFLIGPETNSYGESIMELVEHYQLGAIVGSTTAGANGNFAQISEPSGCSSVFTGLRVTKANGSQFHQIGIKPTIPVARTIAGIAAGRDEVLEKALVYLRAGSR